MAEDVAAEWSLLKNAVVQLSDALRTVSSTRLSLLVSLGSWSEVSAGVLISACKQSKEAAPSSVQGREVSQRQPSGASRPAFSGSAKLSF